MARSWEPEFIRRWEAGETTDQIAAALGIAEGTARSRAYTLQQEGKIQPRPKGGRRERRPSSEHPERSSMPVHNAVQNGAVQTTMHGAVRVHNSAEVPIPAALATELTRLWAAIEALREGLHPTVQNTVQSFPEPLFDDPADNTTERWNLYLKRGLRVRIEALARARGVALSRVLQEILWQALTDRQPSAPHARQPGQGGRDGHTNTGPDPPPAHPLLASSDGPPAPGPDHG
jgi:hypothetical protein